MRKRPHSPKKETLHLLNFRMILWPRAAPHPARYTVSSRTSAGDSFARRKLPLPFIADDKSPLAQRKRPSTLSYLTTPRPRLTGTRRRAPSPSSLLIAVYRAMVNFCQVASVKQRRFLHRAVTPTGIDPDAIQRFWEQRSLHTDNKLRKSPPSSSA